MRRRSRGVPPEPARSAGAESNGAESAPTTATPGDVERPGAGVTRRGLLLGGGVGVGVGALAGFTLRGVVPDAAGPAPTGRAASGDAVASLGARQAGVDRPETPQRNALVVVADVPGTTGAESVLALLATLGGAIDRVTDHSRADPLVVPDGPGDLAVTIGIGPRLVSAIDPGLPGATGLPAFASDGELDPALRGGDLMVAVYSSDAAVLHGVAESLLASAPGAARRWSQTGVRGAGEGTIVRNPLGYHDGVIVPHSPEELSENVWIGADSAAADGTIAVIRRLRLDVSRFHSQPVPTQDRVIGRQRSDGAPLSGGALTDEANLLAKTPEGDYLVPVRSHVRAAHPSFTGSALMLRRGYAFSNGVGPGEATDDGLLFMCYQRDIETFTRTQHRLDESDDLMSFVTVTASASFLVVPGRRDGEPLGRRLIQR